MFFAGAIPLCSVNGQLLGEQLNPRGSVFDHQQERDTLRRSNFTFGSGNRQVENVPENDGCMVYLVQDEIM